MWDLRAPVETERRRFGRDGPACTLSVVGNNELGVMPQRIVLDWVHGYTSLPCQDWYSLLRMWLSWTHLSCLITSRRICDRIEPDLVGALVRGAHSAEPGRLVSKPSFG